MTKIFASLAAIAVIGASSLYNTSDAHMMEGDDYRDNRPMRAYSEDYDYSRDSKNDRERHCHDRHGRNERNDKSYGRMDEAQRRKAIERKERHRRHHEEMMMDYYENNKDKVDLHCHDLDIDDITLDVNPRLK